MGGGLLGGDVVLSLGDQNVQHDSQQRGGHDTAAAEHQVQSRAQARDSPGGNAQAIANTQRYRDNGDDPVGNAVLGNELDAGDGDG